MHAVQAATIALMALLSTTFALPNPEPQINPAPTEFGAMCNDASQCRSGLVCRFGLLNRGHQQCLLPDDREYGSSCSSNKDCNVPLICNLNAFGTLSVCTKELDVLGPTVCGLAGGICLSPSSCCSRACHEVKGLSVCM